MGIIAGSGQFPFLVAQGARRKGTFVAVCGFHGNTDPDLAAHCDAFTMLHLGQLNALISFFRKHKVSSLCMAGAISKPRALDLRPDFRVAKLLLRLARSAKGDDVLLRTVTGELQAEGFTVVRPDSLVPDLLGPAGILVGSPSPELWQDIRFGLDTARAVGALDIGQCVVVRSGIVVAVEAIEGTDAALARAGELGGTGCVAIKIAKPGQDERLDLPSIGVGTIAVLSRYRYAALAYEAGRTLFFDREAACAEAGKHGIAIVGIPEDAAAFFDSPSHDESVS